MFGYVQANMSALSPEEQMRYRSAYCGLCHALGERHGLTSRLSLTYDLTFLTLLLSSLYEPEEKSGEGRCIMHPKKKHLYMINPCTEYAADMTVALAYYKCLDDWDDDRNIPHKCYASMLKKKYEKVKELWPEQCRGIEKSLRELSVIEHEKRLDPDAAAACFGRLMEYIVLYKKDRWEDCLKKLGFGLGQYIYLADAAVDLEEDRKHGRYNPLLNLLTSPEDFRITLTMVLGEASSAFECLPLVQDVHLLRNILYSGLWIKYNRGMQKNERTKE